MNVFDQINPATIERRDWQLWLLALMTILVLTLGIILLMYPAVFVSPATIPEALRNSFFGFCLLLPLMVVYLLDRQLTIRRLRRRLLEEQRVKARILEQASTDLVASLPGFSDFQDRLAMDYRRATHTEQPLSVVMVQVEASSGAADVGAASTVLGDAAKVLIGRLRREDSIYVFRPGVFAIILPGASGDHGEKVVERLREGLANAAGASLRFSSSLKVVNYPDQASTARELEQLAVSCFRGQLPVFSSSSP